MIVAAFLLPLGAASLWAQGLRSGSAGGSSQSAANSSATSSSASEPSTPVAQGENSFSGSVPAQLVPGILQLSLQEAIARGLRQNLGLLLSSADVGVARGQRWEQLSSLLPHISAAPYGDVSQVSLAEFGFTFRLPGIPKVVGPFSYLDARVNLSQSVFDWRAINNERAAAEREKSAQYTYKDARDLVVQSVGFAYLQAIADESLIESVTAQVNTAQALYNQAQDQVQAGTSPAIDALRARVELQTRQQQLIQAKNDFSIQKLALARAIGLAPGQQFDLIDKSPYQPFPGITIQDALKRAYASRSDYQAALSDVRAAELARRAAWAGHLPTLSFSGDAGGAGQHFNALDGVYDVRGTVTIPIFAGNQVHGDLLQADAQLRQSRDRLENLRAQIDSDVRTALLNLESASEQVAVAQSNIDLAEQTLAQSRDRFAAGVTNTVEVVQAQESVASAHQAYISSLFTFNYAKISLARAMGAAEAGVQEYFKGK